MAVYDIDGNRIDVGGGGAGGAVSDVSLNQYDKMCRSINHRGWTGDGAVENSIQAFKDSKTHGYYYVETDARWTSDDEAVLYHDDNISGTPVSSMTYAQVLAAVPTIALFEDFIALCRDIGLHPYIELKGTQTSTQVAALYDIVAEYQMTGKVTWICGAKANLQKVQAIDPSARLGLIGNGTAQNISDAQSLQTSTNEVFLDGWLTYITAENLAAIKAAGITLEAYSFGWTTSEITGMDRYITGFTSNSLIAGKVLYDAAMA